MNKYTGRQIAIFADAHALYEPTLAALDDIEKRGITEVYSLGDNIGVGPDPDKLIGLLEERHVISIAGNSEYYISMGIEPFASYFTHNKKLSHTWTLSKLNEHQKGIISLYPHYIELIVGGKNIGLCHFANDVRIDFTKHSTWTYQDKLTNNQIGYEQFMYTNSKEQLQEIEMMIKRYGVDSPFVKGYLSAKDNPLFARKKIDYFDAIVQGHVHFKMYESSDSTDFYTIRAVGMAYGKDPVDTASYTLLKEKEHGFDIEEILVKYDREKMIYSVLNCTSPDKTIQKFINLTDNELNHFKR